MLLALFGIAWASNWAVLVSTSSSWHDYRHSSNVMSMYQEARALGVPPSQIVLMTAGSFQCNPRNVNVGRQTVGGVDLSRGVFPDYKGREVTRETLYRVLTNRGARKPLLSDSDSSVLVYLTGHGGSGVLGFEDSSLHGLTAASLNSMLWEMWVGARYKNVMVMVDSCQSESMIEKLDAPNVLAIASSRKDSPSYSIPRESTMGISEIDRFSLGTSAFLAAWRDSGNVHGVADLMEHYAQCGIDAVARHTARGPARGPALGEFFQRLNTIIT